MSSFWPSRWVTHQGPAMLLFFKAFGESLLDSLLMQKQVLFHSIKYHVSYCMVTEQCFTFIKKKKYVMQSNKQGTSHRGLFEIWKTEAGIGVKNNSSVDFFPYFSSNFPHFCPSGWETNPSRKAHQSIVTAFELGMDN